MHDDSQVIENRVSRVLIERIAPTEVIERRALSVKALHLPGEPCKVDELSHDAFGVIATGDRWGPPWGYHLVPSNRGGRADTRRGNRRGGSGRHRIHRRPGGVPGRRSGLCRGPHPMRRAPASPGHPDRSRDRLQTEPSTSCWRRQRTPTSPSASPPTHLGIAAPPGDALLYVFGGIDLVTFHVGVRELVREISTLNDLMRTLPRGAPRRQRLTAVLARALDVLDLDDVPGTAQQARGVLAEGFAPGAAPDAHRLHAVGHAHIDTAWLWPMRETRRKCARTFANQIRLMEKYPEHVFVCSQAAQYYFVEQDHPELFQEIHRRATEGRWVPVGGMWVEADMNLPNGGVTGATAGSGPALLPSSASARVATRSGSPTCSATREASRRCSAKAAARVS
ncbi:MAG: hypothetical protein M5U19_09255 [Microthrixaceae bacterium]|nr:hypothetical protein [Microthrixaceae bacterium]